MAGGGCEEQQGLAECVELELMVDPVSGDVPAARIARQADRVLVGHLA